jgi:hypothetical protein
MIRSLLFSSLLVTMTAAWTMTGTAVSGFHGAVVMSRMPSSSSSTLQMKKGKSNVPIQMRGQYKKAQELSQMRQEMIAASQAGDDGLPVFNLFVRTKRGNVSPIRVGDLMHDEFSFFFVTDVVPVRKLQRRRPIRGLDQELGRQRVVGRY